MPAVPRSGSITGPRSTGHGSGSGTRPRSRATSTPRCCWRRGRSWSARRSTSSIARAVGRVTCSTSDTACCRTRRSRTCSGWSTSCTRDPSAMADVPSRVAVVGAGVTGLTAAFRLQVADPSIDVVVLEASQRPGGTLRTVEVAGIPLDAGPDSFLGRKPWATELCRELGIETTRPAATGTWLGTRGGLVPYPAGTAFGIPGDLGDLIQWRGLSGRGRRRALRDLVIRKRREDGDETLGGLLRRRLGDEATDRALAPLLSGLFGGDVDTLSADATFPELHRWERAQGSLIRGAQAALRDAKGGGPRPPMFVRPRPGPHDSPTSSQNEPVTACASGRAWKRSRARTSDGRSAPHPVRSTRMRSP